MPLKSVGIYLVALHRLTLLGLMKGMYGFRGFGYIGKKLRIRSMMKIVNSIFGFKTSSPMKGPQEL